MMENLINVNTMLTALLNILRIDMTGSSLYVWQFILEYHKPRTFTTKKNRKKQRDTRSRLHLM